MNINTTSIDWRFDDNFETPKYPGETLCQTERINLKESPTNHPSDILKIANYFLENPLVKHLQQKNNQEP
jgi:hypothetical protein